MNKKLLSALPLLLGLLAGHSQAAVSLDRTRVIYPGEAKSISLTIRNNNKTLPYLAQAWLEDANGNKVNSPFTVLPPVQRLEPGMESLLKIQALPTLSLLPQDKESLFYFNMREIPPRSDKPNTLQIALQTRVKLFYRPAAIAAKTGANQTPWQEALTLTRQGDSYLANNPTPYFVTLIDATKTLESASAS
ncbi:MAG TPA: fimbrial protein, partial [Aeromonas salmonicida]|nr:fimbrial protein [Aeromonas salmonicida]